MLIFQIKRIISSENGLTTSLLFFFFVNAKNLGRSDDAKRRKEIKRKEDGITKENWKF